MKQPQQRTCMQTARNGFSTSYAHARAQRAKHARWRPRAEARKAHSCDLCKAHASKQPATASTASARHMHTRASAASGACKPRSEARGEHTPTASAKHMQATACSGFSTPCHMHTRKHNERSTRAAVGGERRAYSMQPQQSTRMCACRHFAPASACDEQAHERIERARKPEAVGRGAESTLVKPLQSTPSK